MKISEMIQALSQLKKQHGDVEVVCLHNLGEHAKTQLDVIDGMSYYTTVEHVMHRSGGNGFDGEHILITL